MKRRVVATEEGRVGRPGIVVLTVAAVAAGIVNLSIAARALGTWMPTEGAEESEVAATEATAATTVTPASRPGPATHLDLAEDELLRSPMLSNPEFQAEVRRWIRFWASVPEERFPSYLSRMSGFEPIVDSILAANDLPWSLRYLPIIESGYDPTAVSRASAVGMWQFMAPTAGDFGVEVTRLVDDRRDPFESTAAAARFLSDLHAEFGSWFLALAAYNAGPGRIRKIIQRHAPGAQLDDRLYWRIRPHLPKETQDYVPNLFGAIFVATDPESYGYETPDAVPFEFDRVPVLGRVHFETVARATGSSADEIARLNPEYVQGMTPDQQVVDLRVPAGRGAAFRDYFTQEPQTPGGGRP